MPSLITPESREDIELFFSTRHSGWVPFVEMAQSLRNEPYASSLFGKATMMGLLIRQTSPIRWMHAMLRIEHGPTWDEIKFEYFEREPRRDKLRPENNYEPWRTTSKAADAVAKLEHILVKRLRWFRAV